MRKLPKIKISYSKERKRRPSFRSGEDIPPCSLQCAPVLSDDDYEYQKNLLSSLPTRILSADQLNPKKAVLPAPRAKATHLPKSSQGREKNRLKPETERESDPPTNRNAIKRKRKRRQASVDIEASIDASKEIQRTRRKTKRRRKGAPVHEPSLVKSMEYSTEIQVRRVLHLSRRRISFHERDL